MGERIHLSFLNSTKENARRQHNVIPELSLVSNITHVALAFMRPEVFNQEDPSSFQLFTTIEKVRSRFADGTKIMVAIGGWGDTRGFEVAAATDSSRQRFAKSVRKMVDVTGADGSPMLMCEGT